MSKRDYYEVLGVERSVTTVELKKSYRKKAHEFHPDRNPDNPASEEKFKEASEAYAVLNDAEKRNLYDQFGHDGLRRSGYNGFSGFEEAFSSFGDIFEDFFGFGGKRSSSPNQPRRGVDLRYDLEIDFLEAVFGVEKEFEIEKYIFCGKCKGKKSEPGHSPVTCPTCQGQGKVTRSQGFFSIATACPSCHGEGVKITHPCKKCKGAGSVRERKMLSMKAPAGVDTGSRLRLRGEGEPGKNGGPAGDLYVVIHVKEHENFERHGDDVVVIVPISLPQAVLGADIKISALEGEIDFTVKAGTQSDTLTQVSGHGVPRLQSYGRGDLIVRIVLETPKKLSQREEELYRELAKETGSNVRAHQKGFFEKLMT